MYVKKFTIKCSLTDTNNIYYINIQERTKCKYRGSIYALSMFIHYPNYKHRVPNEAPGLILGQIFELAYSGAHICGAYIQEVLY